MTYRINYNGIYIDSLVISGDTIEEIREIAKQETEKRGWEEKDCWSEKID